jgi:sugar-specific transcriptional regulator TrmB
MSVEEREITALRRLGLTEYESRIYLVLVKMGPIKASELSFFGQIPRTKTYGAIKELERKGLLRIIPGKPEAYAPSSPGEVLIPLANKLSNELASAQAVVESLALAYETGKFIKRETPKESQEFWEINGRPGIINKLNQIFGDSSKAINYCTTAMGLVRTYKAHCEMLEKVHKHGTRVRILSPINSENSGVGREIAEVLEFKILDKPFGENFVTIDSHELVVIETKPEDLRTDQGADTAVWTTNRLLVDLHDQLFDRLWSTLPSPKFPNK